MKKIMVFIPMYNCEKQIIRVLKQLDGKISKYISKIVIVNNRSTDNGEKVVLDYLKKKNKDNIILFRNDNNYNLGGSHKVAFDYAIRNNYDYLIVLHGDDQGNINEILPCLESGIYEDYDCLLGSRFMKGSKLKGYSKFRTFGNKVYNIIFSIAIGRHISDLGSGLNMYSVKSLKKKYYMKYPDRLTFNCFMLFALRSYNITYRFFPITWREDDQVSNVKMFSQAMNTLSIAIKYFFFRKKYLDSEHRTNIIKKYTAKEIKEKGN